MIPTLVAVAGAAALFVIFGLLHRGRERVGCDGCTCRGDVCDRTGEPRHLELLESNDARS